ncbi:MAG TPA: PAS domain-containing protein, partial [bacterium]
MRVDARHRWLAYGAATLLVAAMAGATALRVPVELALPVFCTAVLACAALGGAGPGAIAALGGVLVEALVTRLGSPGMTVIHAALGAGSVATGWVLDRLEHVRVDTAASAARQYAEEQLVYSQNLLQTVFDTLPISVLVKDREGRYVMVNRTWLTRYGLEQANVIGQTTLGLPGRPGPDRERAQQEDEAVFTRGITVEFHGKGTGRPGEPRTFHTIKAPLRDAEGRVSGLVGVVVDTTEARRVEDALRDSQRLLRTTVDTMPHNLFVKDLQGRHLLVNQRFCTTLGLTEEQILGRTLDEINVLDPEAKELAKAEDRQVLAGEAIAAPVYRRFLRDSTEERYFQSFKSPLRDQTGAIVGLVGLSIEVTTEVLARRAAETAHAHFVDAIESLPAALYMLDAQERLVLWNRLTVQFLPEIGGRIRVGMTLEEILRIAATSRVTDAGGRLEEWVQQRLQQFRTNPGPFEQRWNDGRWIQGIDRRMSDGGTICMRFDITEAKQREEHLRQSQKLEAIGHLAGGIAHDFNNMLTIMRSYAEFIVRAADATAKSKADAKIISQTTTRAAALTQQLLAFSRRQVLRLEEIDINHVVGSMEGMLRRLIGEHIELATALDGALRPIKADPTQVEQVILNLVVNSRDAMLKGGRLLLETENHMLDGDYLQAHAEVQPGRYVMLAVTDSGVGMDEETQKHIFEPFFTTKPPGEGTGMGLATVYGIVKQLKGFIYVYSEAGHGATFKIYFPESDGVGVAAPAVVTEREVVGANGETVLLVEDEDLVRR